MKKVKINIIQTILIIVGILAIIFGTLFYLIVPHSVTTLKNSTSTTTIYENRNKIIPRKSNIKYNILSTYASAYKLENSFVTSHEELLKILYKSFNIYFKEININNQPVTTYFDDNFFANNNLAIQMYDTGDLRHNYSIASVTTKNSIATVNIKDDVRSGGILAGGTKINFIVLDKNIKEANFIIYRTNTFNFCLSSFLSTAGIASLIVIIIISILVINHNKRVDNKQSQKNLVKSILLKLTITILVIIALFFYLLYAATNVSDSTLYKPIIYLYPTQEEKVSVKLLYDDKITVSYPKYNKKWNVLAQKDGSLIDLSTNRNLYSLYYESENVVKFKIEKDGFIVKGEDSATFLEEKLAILGLTEREAEEFIIYWLPILESNKYNYIRFASIDEINENMPLEISPSPDTIIRVIMTYKGLDKPIKLKEQKLITPNRNGFVAVEWGGTEIK